MIETFKRHWPEYIYEAIGLALFMTFAGGLTVLLEHPDSPVHAAIPSKMLRHVVLGIVMGTYIGLLIYSPWGRKTGAHINPAVTIAFWRMGKISKADAIFYIIAQFVGALITARLLFFFIGNAFAHPDVKYGATVPGPQGALVAFAAEFAISFLLLFVILIAINSTRLKKLDGLFGRHPDRALSDVRDAAFRDEPEPGAHLRFRGDRAEVRCALGLLLRADSRDVAGGGSLHALPVLPRHGCTAGADGKESGITSTADALAFGTSNHANKRKTPESQRDQRPEAALSSEAVRHAAAAG
jgi:glycerol uptake facilitator-like aquaporin